MLWCAPNCERGRASVTWWECYGALVPSQVVSREGELMALSSSDRSAGCP
jgi:hypothetical protein